MLTAGRASAREGRQLAIPLGVARPSAGVVVALARVETKKLLLNPAFLSGLALVGAFALLVTGDGFPSRNLALVAVTIAAVALIAATLLGTSSCALRAHRDGVRELFGSLPAPPEARTGGLLLALFAGPGALAVIVAIVGFPVLRGDPGLRPYIGLSFPPQIPLTVVALGAFGMALARWIRHPIAAPVALVAHVMTPLAWVLPWIGSEKVGMRMGWHYAYLVASIVLWSSVAFAGDRRGAGDIWHARAFWVAPVALAVVIVAALLQIPPGGLL